MKRKHSLVSVTCKNCGTQAHGRYCHACGQDLFKGINRSIKDLIFNFFENIFVLDNKLLKTLLLLVCYPGKLSSEYVKGRIVSYVHPSKLFWFISIIFFALLIGQIDWKELSNIDNLSGEEIEALKQELNNNENGFDLYDYVEKLKRKDSSIGWNLKDSFSTYAPYMSVVMIPLFAFCLLLLFRKKSRYYVDHLTFALHYHTFVFLIHSLHFLILKFFTPFYPNWWVTLCIPMIYLVVALYVFYRPKIFPLIWKTILFSILYLTLLILIFVLIGIIIAEYIS